MMRASETEGVPKVEKGLTAFFAAGNPDHAFVLRLEQQLWSQAAAQAAGPTTQAEAPRPIWAAFLPRRRGAAVALAIVLALVALVATVATVALIGPSRVLADIQRLLSYVPGIGFSELNQTLVLKAPVEVTRDGVTVRIEQAVADKGQTRIVFSSDGLPPNTWLGGVTGGGGDTDIGVALRLPDGQALHPNQWAYRYGGATLQFPALPRGVTQATLDVTDLPLVPAGTAPRNWHLPLSLVAATGQVVAGRFAQPYAPSGASDTHAGVTLRVLQVAHDVEETALRVQVAWTEPQMTIPFLMGGRTLPVLRDDLGHVYQEKRPSSIGSSAGVLVQARPAGATRLPVPAGGTLEQTLTFEPVSSAAHRLTLVIDGLDVELATRAGFGRFGLDLGEHPALGESWPLDARLQVAGFPVHLTGARLIEEELPLGDGIVKRTNLEFDVDQVADRNGRTLRGLTLAADSPSFNGSGGGYTYQTNRMRVNINLREGEQVPSGPLTVTVTGATVIEAGPWQPSWEVPER